VLALVNISKLPTLRKAICLWHFHASIIHWSHAPGMSTAAVASALIFPHLARHFRFMGNHSTNALEKNSAFVDKNVFRA
jgi:hypothetical protein